jgi:hypothetical protein
MAERMIKEGKTAVEIDQVVKIDDGPALAALAKLDEHVHKMRRASAADMYATVDDVQATVIHAAVITALLLAGAIIAFIFFARRRDEPPRQGRNRHRDSR